MKRTNLNRKCFESPFPSPMASSPKSTIINKYKKQKATALNNLAYDDNKTLITVSDLKQLASSRSDDLKRIIDLSHSEILKDLEASHSRFHRRFKVQTQTCQQLMDEAEKEHKKMCERISESQEAMKGSYVEFMEDAQASASTVCKTSIPQLSRSFEKAITALQSNYGISSSDRQMQ